MLEQQSALLRTEGVHVVFEDSAVTEIARLAAEINRSVENIGARRLHTVIEKIMEEISFSASETGRADGGTVTVDVGLVHRKLVPLMERSDLKKFIL